MSGEKNKWNASYSVLRVGIYLICIVCFVLNSFAIFKDYLINPTIISTKISKTTGGLLDFPTILICNDTVDKDTATENEFSGNFSDNLKLEDLLIDIHFLKDAGHDFLKANSSSIKQNFKKLFTAFHGGCFISREKFKVSKL